jgi:F-box/leucine-rich repeat protein 10/11
VQYYCLTSATDSYTDFHIDFGGTSVWYHIVQGQKEFLLIPPTESNLKKYEDWLCSPNQNEIFFGDLVDHNGCFRVKMDPGMTLIIPTAWIHAVYTPGNKIFKHDFLCKNSLTT